MTLCHWARSTGAAKTGPAKRHISHGLSSHELDQRIQSPSAHQWLTGQFRPTDSELPEGVGSASMLECRGTI
jgi:hypothetical protein